MLWFVPPGIREALIFASAGALLIVVIGALKGWPEELFGFVFGAAITNGVYGLYRGAKKVSKRWPEVFATIESAHKNDAGHGYIVYRAEGKTFRRQINGLGNVRDGEEVQIRYDPLEPKHYVRLTDSYQIFAYAAFGLFVLVVLMALFA